MSSIKLFSCQPNRRFVQGFEKDVINLKSYMSWARLAPLLVLSLLLVLSGHCLVFEWWLGLQTYYVQPNKFWQILVLTSIICAPSFQLGVNMMIGCVYADCNATGFGQDSDWIWRRHYIFHGKSAALSFWCITCWLVGLLTCSVLSMEGSSLHKLVDN